MNKKEYNYYYADGTIVRATQSTVTLTVSGLVTSKSLVYGLLGKQIGVKTYTSTWSNLMSIGLGFVWPASLDLSASYSYYTYRGHISISDKIKKFVNNETKGLKA